MTPFDILMCFLFAAVAGTGVGGGGLFLLWLTDRMSVPHTAAQALNLFFFLSASIPATLRRAAELAWKQALFCMLAGVPGVFLGSWVRGLVNETILRKLFGAVLALGGVLVLTRQEKDAEKPESPPKKQRPGPFGPKHPW